MYIVGNKVDLLPRDGPGYLDRVKGSLVKLCEVHGVTPKHVALVSAKTGFGVEKLITRLLRDWKLQGLSFWTYESELVNRRITEAKMMRYFADTTWLA